MAKISSHECTQKEAIARINLLLVGNGNPESGLAFKVSRMSDKFETLHDDIKDIKESVRDLTKMYDDTFDAASSVASAFEQYKAEKESYRQGKDVVISDLDKQKAENRAKVLKTLQTIGVVIAGLSFIVMATFTVLNYERSASIKTEVEKIDSTNKENTLHK